MRSSICLFHWSIILRLLLLASGLVLQSCQVAPKYEPPSIPIQDQWIGDEFSKSKLKRQPLETTATQAEEKRELRQLTPTEQAWWAQFNDPLLMAYLERASLENHSIQQAWARLTRARAVYAGTRSRLFPLLEWTGRAERRKNASLNSNDSDDDGDNNNSGRTRNFFEQSLEASWQLDLFGASKQAIGSASAAREAMQADVSAVQLSVVTEVAQTYYRLRGIQKQIKTTQRNTGLLKKTLDLIQARVLAGEASQFDLKRAHGEYQVFESRLPNLQAELQATWYQLAWLLGVSPEALSDDWPTEKSLPTLSNQLTLGLRTNLLQKRPDVRYAERSLKSKHADMGLAITRQFPTLSLTAGLGLEARKLSGLGQSGSPTAHLGALFNWPLFDAGSRKHAVSVASAEVEEAIVVYRSTVLRAMTDAEQALIRYLKSQETQEKKAAIVITRRESFELANDLYQAGEESYLSVLDAERELVASEDELVIAETQSLLNIIALYSALGGAWSL